MGKNKNRNPQQVEPSTGHMVSVQGAAYSGPLPHPQHLQQYEEIVPGAADRIIRMAETQSSHRQKLEYTVLKSDVFNSRLGMIFGFVLGTVGLVGGFYLILQDKAIPGSVVGIGTLVSLVSTFVYGSRQRRAERERQQ